MDRLDAHHPAKIRHEAVKESDGIGRRSSGHDPRSGWNAGRRSRGSVESRARCRVRHIKEEIDKLPADGDLSARPGRGTGWIVASCRSSARLKQAEKAGSAEGQGQAAARRWAQIAGIVARRVQSAR
jgi:hypothetical protein